MICFRCEREVEVSGKVGRLDSCPQCSSDLHVCRNCKYYDPFAHQQCREPQVELVRDKEKSNYCEYFTPNDKRGASGGRSKADDARSAFDNLFKKS